LIHSLIASFQEQVVVEVVRIVPLAVVVEYKVVVERAVVVEYKVVVERAVEAEVVSIDTDTAVAVEVG
jgi:hypothetical protein